MKKTTNPYRRKRNKVIIIYLMTMVAAFLLGTVLFGLYDSTGAAFFRSLGFIFILIDSLGMILLVPFLICVVKLSKQAKLYDEQMAAPPEPVKIVTDSVGEMQIERRDGRIGYHYKKMYDREMGPWWSAIGLLFILPPLGAVFCFLKAYREPQNSLKNALMLSSTGYVLAGLGAAIAVLPALIGIDDTEALVKAMIFPACILICAALMLYYAAILNKKGRMIARVQKLVWIDAVLNIDELSIQLNMTYGETIAMLQSLIDEGFLYTCFIDFAARELISTIQLRKTAKKCRHCGGTTTFIAGTAAVCDYCGRFLK